MLFDHGAASSSSAPARNAGCGCSIATRSAARIIGRRSTPRRSSATTRRRSTRSGIWGSLSAWQDGTGTQWVLAPFWGPVSKQFKAPIEHSRPTGGGVAAFKLVDRAGKWQLTPAWLSRDMDLAEETVIANGVVFAYAAGEDATQVVPDVAWNEPGGPKYGGGLNSGPARRIPSSQQGRALRARRTDRQGALVERHSDRIVESLQRTDRRQRPRLHRDVRRHPVLLRSETVTSFQLPASSHMLNESRALKTATPFAVLLLAATVHGQVGRGARVADRGGGRAADVSGFAPIRESPSRRCRSRASIGSGARSSITRRAERTG